MNRLFNRFVALVAAIVAFSAVSCDKVENDRIEYLEVTANNIQGDWELYLLGGEPLKGDTYFHISFDRAEKTYEYKTNLTSVPTSFATQKGTYAIYTDVELGAYIRGIDFVQREWTDRYVITELAKDTMKWTGVKNPSDIRVFKRLEK